MPSLTPSELERFLAVAQKAALAGGQRAHRYFGKKITVIKKLDRSPVTRADREAEKVIRGILGKAFPDHQLCGEEFGWEKKHPSPFKWWIDPVDGTRQFVRGLPFWSTLVALEAKGEVVAGVIHHPAHGLTLLAAKGLGCTANGKPARVSRIPSLKTGTMTYGGIRLMPSRYRGRFTSFLTTCHDDRGFGDAFGHSLVVMGRVEAMLDPIVKPYDVAAVKICVEEAGGKFTDLSGKGTLHGGNALSSNGLVHGRVLRAVQ